MSLSLLANANTLAFFMQQIDDKQRRANNYLRYSGVGFQIAAIIGLGVFIGYRLDIWINTSQPYFTLLFALIFIPLGLYSGLKEIVGKKK